MMTSSNRDVIVLLNLHLFSKQRCFYCKFIVVLRRFEAEAIFSFRTTTKKQMYISIGQLEQQNKLD